MVASTRLNVTLYVQCLSCLFCVVYEWFFLKMSGYKSKHVVTNTANNNNNNNNNTSLCNCFTVTLTVKHLHSHFLFKTMKILSCFDPWRIIIRDSEHQVPLYKTLRKQSVNCWMLVSCKSYRGNWGMWYKLFLEDLFKIYITIIFLPFSMGVELGRQHWGRNVGWGCLRLGWWGEYFGLRETRQIGSGENYIMWTFVIWTAHQILFGWSNREQWDGRGM